MKTPENIFKRALRDGKQQYGLWQGLCSPLAAELCAWTGYDWLLIDGEHAPNDLRTVLSQLQAIAGTPAQAVVRLPDGEPTRIKQFLDIGAQSLLIPMVETATQAHELVRAVTYPPAGIRGVGTALARAARWNQVDGYFDDVGDELCLLLQIESVTGLENLDDILAVDGIDGVFIGPTDLAASMGYLGNPAHPDVVSAVENAIGRIDTAGKSAGTLATNKTVATRYEAAGARFIALGVETLLLAQAAKATLQAHHSDDVSPNRQQGNGAY